MKKKILTITLIVSIMGIMSACSNVKDTKTSDITGVESSATASDAEDTAETEAVAVNEDGEVVDGKTGEKLTSEEVEQLKKDSVLNETEDGKVSVNEANNKKTAKAENDNKKEETKTSSNNSDKIKEEKTTENKKNSTTEAPKKETTTEKPKTETTTEKPKTETTTEKSKSEPTTQAPKKETTTEAPKKETTTEKTTEASCSHNWVWKTHTETVHHSEKYKIGDAYDEDVVVQICVCDCGERFPAQSLEESRAAYRASGHAHGGYHTENYVARKIHHEAEYGVDEWDTTEEVKDYQYCSKCGVKK